MSLLLDTTALLALHVACAQQRIVEQAMASNPVWCASAMALAESLAGIDRLTEEPVLREEIEDALRRTWDYIHVVPVDQRCIDEASLISRTQPVSLGSALHLAAAQRLPGPVSLVTFDPGQITIAMGMGYEIVSA
jgi:PIN domain nuclease of toxin-antitoxin system